MNGPRTGIAQTNRSKEFMAPRNAAAEDLTTAQSFAKENLAPVSCVTDTQVTSYRPGEQEHGSILIGCCQQADANLNCSSQQLAVSSQWLVVRDGASPSSEF